MTTVGRAEITVVADASEFDRQMRRLVAAARRGFGGMRREADTSFKGAGDASRRFGNVLSIVTTGLGRFRDRMAGAFGSAQQFRSAMGGVLSSLRGAIAGFRDSGNELGNWRDENGRLHDATGRFIADTRRGFAGIDISLKGVVGNFGRLVGIMGRVTAGGLAVGGIAGALGAATASAVQFTAALAPAAGIVAGLPAAIGVGAAALATLQTALSGVGDAFGAAIAGDAEKFEEALEGLSPNAREAATALRDITPVFSELRAQVQDAFFAGFADTLNQVAAATAGPLQSGMTAAASAMSGLVSSLGDVVASASGVAFIETSFAALTNIVNNLREPIATVVQGFFDVGTAVNEAFGGEDAAAGLASMVQQFGEFLSAAAASGDAVGWVENAMAVFSAIGDILAPIVGILGSVGEAAQATGGNILGALGAALEAVNEFLASAEGMAVLESIFTTLNAVGSAFGDVIAGLLPVIAPVIAQLVSGLVPVLEAITPLLLDIAAAAAPLFTQILDAVMPLIPPLVEIAQQLLPLLATALSGLLTAVAPLLEALVMLLVSVLEPLLPALMPLVEIFAELALQLAEALTPILELLGEILTWIVNEIIVPFVIPIIEFLVELLGDTLASTVEALGVVFEAVITAIVEIATWLKEQWELSTAAISLAWDLLKDGLSAGKDFIVNNVINPIADFFRGMGDTIGGILDDIEGGFDSVVGFLGGIPGRISGALSDMWSPIWDGFRSAINSVINGWNNLSFTVPSVDLGPLGTVGGFTISTPNVPTLQTSGFSFGEGAVVLHPNEAIVNAKDPRGIGMLADALAEASTMTAGPGLAGDVEVRVFIGERELTDIVDVQIEARDRTLAHRARTGSGRR